LDPAPAGSRSARNWSSVSPEVTRLAERITSLSFPLPREPGVPARCARGNPTSSSKPGCHSLALRIHACRL